VVPGAAREKMLASRIAQGPANQSVPLNVAVVAPAGIVVQ